MSTFFLQKIRPALAPVRNQYTQSQRLYKAKMTRPFSSFIVTPKDLHDELRKNTSTKSPKTIPVSAEWFLPNDGRDGRQEFLQLRIPGARFFDLDTIKDPVSPYPHMVPTASIFTEAMKYLGISRDDTVVVYDSPALGIFSAPRAAWTFKVFGHPKVHLLNNFKQWVDGGYPTESGPEKPIAKTEYPVVVPNHGMISTFEEIKGIAQDNTNCKKIQIIDARPNGRWAGKDPEPRPGLSSGHVPRSISLPFSSLIDPTTKGLKSAEELKEVLFRSGVDPSSDVEKRLMCGTGVTAVVLDVALEQAGFGGNRKVYDGSWTEWAQRVDESSGLIVKS
ncbi:thiosulfate sulfurtransferase [Terfezia boudieri ATCC MYA-4762]|uniref:Thiosulfate sulfurtransferase n=1 Tax=Terfezia boudieri ATCC MYA-4762 TaxID=1051890 RepID=A0A3N4M0G6_9PEZI|nr:thiosulfate sulfurtransferase [Terfezia boudieri ATCC MYA-4762]